MRFRGDGDLPFQLDQLLNEGLRFDDNFESAQVEFETTGEVQELQHGLGYVPIGYFIIYKGASVEVFGHEEEEWTEDLLKVNSTESGVTVRMLVL